MRLLWGMCHTPIQEIQQLAWLKLAEIRCFCWCLSQLWFQGILLLCFTNKEGWRSLGISLSCYQCLCCLKHILRYHQPTWLGSACYSQKGKGPNMKVWGLVFLIVLWDTEEVFGLLCIPYKDWFSQKHTLWSSVETKWLVQINIFALRHLCTNKGFSDITLCWD